MSTRSRLILAGAVVVVLAVAAGGWFLLRSSAAGDSGPAARLPGKAGIAALAKLSAPTAIGPLPGSTPSPDVTGAYTIGKSCDAVRDAYRGDGAPLPAGATVANGSGDVIVVTDAFGDAEGIVLHGTGAHSCTYTLVSQPTIQVSGSGAIPEGDYWASVGCAFTKGDPAAAMAAASFSGHGSPWVIMAAPADSTDGSGSGAYTVMIAQATVAQIGESNDADMGTAYHAVPSVTADGRLVVKLAGSKAQTVSMTCTTTFGQIFGGFAGAV